MAITFEEVTGEIQPAARVPAGGEAAAPPPAEALREQIERELLLRDERAARLRAD